MFIRDILGQTCPAISFEIFPPKPETPLESIFDTIGALKNLNPDFISVTYGAGGSSRDRTTDIASAVQNRWGLTSLAHLTCFGSTPPEVEEVVEVLEQEGVKNILALRGDPRPENGGSEGPFKYASDLIKYIRKGALQRLFQGLPPTRRHSECSSPKATLGTLKKKLTQGRTSW